MNYFRIRNKKTKEVMDKNFPIFLTQDGRVIMESNEPVMYGNSHIDDMPFRDITTEVDVEFFTGKLDRNGNEIFQGDTVSSSIGNSRALVIFEDSQFKFKWLDKTSLHYRQFETEPMFHNTHIVFEVEE